MQTEREIREQICEIGRRMYNRNMVAANDGNISVRLNDREFLCTPTGVSKGFMTQDCICKVDANGHLLQASGSYRPSSEMKMHMRVYQERPDVNAVVHAHPAYATTFAVAGLPLDRPIMPEAVVSLGYVPVTRYAKPSTAEVPDAVSEFVHDFDAMLLQNHGALTYADTLLDAYMKMESVEFYAQLMYQVKQLGAAKELTEEQVKELYAVRRKLGLKGRHPADSRK